MSSASCASTTALTSRTHGSTGGSSSTEATRRPATTRGAVSKTWVARWRCFFLSMLYFNPFACHGGQIWRRDSVSWRNFQIFGGPVCCIKGLESSFCRISTLLFMLLQE